MSVVGSRVSHISFGQHGRIAQRRLGLEAKKSTPICRSTPFSDNAPSTSAPSPTADHQSTTTTVTPVATGKRIAVLKASKAATRPVAELDRSLAEYMTLPASQYSVLDAKRIERLDEDTFRCYVGGLHFLNFHVEPVLTLSVVVGEKGPTVKLLETQLQGSKAIEEANKRFTATMTNVVQWQEAVSGGKELASDTEIQVTLEVPGWFVLPTKVIEKSGCAVMQKVLNTAVPRFLQQLEEDYVAWASGDESRQPMASSTSAAAPSGRHAVLHDFCMCIPFGIFVAAGGLLSAIWTGLPGLYVAAAGFAEIILSSMSLKTWKKGKSSIIYTLFEGAIASAVAYSAWNSFKQGIAKWATGSLLGLSASAALFFFYNVLAGGNPPKTEGASMDGADGKEE